MPKHATGDNNNTCIRESEKLKFFKLVEQGGLLRMEENYHNAMIAFNECVQLFPNMMECYLERGVCFQLRNEHLNAIKDFRTGLELAESCFFDNGSESAVAYYKYILKGLIYETNNQWQEALTCYVKAQQSHAGGFYAPFSIAYVYFYLTDTASTANLMSSLQNFELAMDLFKRDQLASKYLSFYLSIIHTNLAWMNTQLHRIDKALGLYQTAIRLNPRHIRAYYSRASLYKALDKEEAIEDYSKCLSLFREQRSLILHQLFTATSDQEIKGLQTAKQRIEYRMALTLEDRGVSYLDVDIGKARIDFHDAIALAPGEMCHSYLLLACVYFDTYSDVTAGLKILEAGIAACSKRPDALGLYKLFELRAEYSSDKKTMDFYRSKATQIQNLRRIS